MLSFLCLSGLVQKPTSEMSPATESPGRQDQTPDPQESQVSPTPVHIPGVLQAHARGEPHHERLQHEHWLFHMEPRFYPPKCQRSHELEQLYAEDGVSRHARERSVSPGLLAPELRTRILLREHGLFDANATSGDDVKPDVELYV
jgi:hypothetical protein